ncbi:porin [Microvirga sp. 2MCAF38]|uniref:porin n=1 Tax=Microvirga sp. 2MCAF38 TaxID=3232989 RepID=UPI003F9AD67F
MKMRLALPVLLLMAMSDTAGASPREAAALPVGIAHSCMPGFTSVPGTRTCLRVSGRIRSDVVMGGPSSRSHDNTRIASDGRLTFDARTQTEYGPLRVVIRVQGATR